MTTIFLSTSFEDGDRARADVIASLIRGVGPEVVFGDNLNGQSVSTSVRERIESSDALIAILSRRRPLADGNWMTHPWVIEEATWAAAKGKRVLRVVEDGVQEIGGIIGDVENIRFSTGQFERCILKILGFARFVSERSANRPAVQTVERRPQPRSVVVDEPLEAEWSEEVQRLVKETRNRAALELFSDALGLSNQAIRIDPTCWRAYINRGVALVHLGRYAEADATFDEVASTFSRSGSIVAKALHNKAWLIGVRDGFDSERTLRMRKDLYLQALALDNRRLMSRAMVLICMVLLEEEESSRPFLEASMRWEGFLGALRGELDALGALGLKAAHQFPSWLRNLLYPTESVTAKGGRYES